MDHIWTISMEYYIGESEGWGCIEHAIHKVFMTKAEAEIFIYDNLSRNAKSGLKTVPKKIRFKPKRYDLVRHYKDIKNL